MAVHQYTALLDLPTVESPNDPYTERILDTARREFETHGLRRTSLNRIAEEAGVSRRTLFNRFPNRTTLIVTVVVRELRRAVAEIEAAIDSAASPEDKVIAGFVTAAQVVGRPHLMRQLLATDRDQVLPLLTTDAGPALALVRAAVAAQLRNARQAGFELAIPIDLLSDLFARQVISVLVEPSGPLPLDDPERLADAARAIVLPLLGPLKH